MTLAAIDMGGEGACDDVGTVVAVRGREVVVRSGAGVQHARRAVSCLVEPESGDRVLLAHAEEAYVIAILERQPDHGIRVAPEGDVCIDLATGRLTLAARHGIDFISKEAVTLAADRLEAHARSSRLVSGGVEIVARTVHATIDCLTQMAGRIYRRVRDLEHVRAGRIDCASEGNLRLHGDNTLLTARGLVKADGQQIHLG